MDLESLGWTPLQADAFRAIDEPPGSHFAGRVASEHRNGCLLYAERGELNATVAGRLRHHAEDAAALPAVGDWVAARMRPDGEKAVIHHVLPRRSKFSRKVPGRQTEEQVIAANVDLVFIVSGIVGDFNARRIERYLALTWESGATPVVVLTKADLAATPDEARVETEAVAPSVPVHVVSGVTGAGVDDLRAYLARGRTVALLGSSGAGKSTLANALLGTARQAVADMARTGKGRHTTTRRELILAPGGALLIDTPGMRELQLWEGAAGMQDAFADIDALASGCRFSDCKHESEPGCAVLAAVESGVLGRERLEGFHKLRREVAHFEAKQDEIAQSSVNRRSRTMTKALRSRLRDKYR